MVPLTIVGSGDIIKKGSAIINPGTVQIVISPHITKHLQEKDHGQVLNSIRETICANLKTMS
jgi:1-acyl-sn-glycerol-3-phosphate acyltransferase